MTSGTPRLEIAPAAFASRDTQRLVDEVQEEYVRLYGSPDSSPIEHGVFEAPRGAFFLGRVAGEPVAMGGWRWREDVAPYAGQRVAEVKRMYVAPRARRQGHAQRLLDHLEATAAAAGAPVMVLETGTQQPAAIAMYTASGYQPIPGYGYYRTSPLSRCFAKRLS